MKVGLFIPCYIDQFYPQVAIATLSLLEKLNITVEYPLSQTCCGQPLANAGFEHLTGSCNSLFMNNFGDSEYIVSPSGSCVLHLKEHLNSESRPEEAALVKSKIFELSEFLVDIVQVKKLSAFFPHKVGMHQGCHGQRGLKLSQMSELVAPPFSKPGELLGLVKGLEFVPLQRQDECCGFGGTFAVGEEAVSVKMGKDRVADHQLGGAEYITSADMSCLMHLEGILRRQNSAVKVIHLAEILNAEA